MIHPDDKVVKNSRIRNIIQILLPEIFSGRYIRFIAKKRTIESRYITELMSRYFVASLKKTDITKLNQDIHNEIVKNWDMKIFIDNFYYLKDGYQKKRVSQIIEASYPIRNNDIVIDIGSWIGTFAFHSATFSKMSIAVDYSLEVLKKGKDIISSKFPNLVNKIYFIQADVTALPFKGGMADIVFSCDCIEHLPKESHYRYINELLRVMGRKGKALIHSPNLIYFRIKDYILKLISEEYREYVRYLKKNPTMENPLYNISHIGLTEPLSVMRLIRKTGFGGRHRFILNRNNFYVPKISKYALTRPLTTIFRYTPFIKWIFCDKWLLVLYGDRNPIRGMTRKQE